MDIDHSTAEGASDALIAAAEDRLGHRFPLDYRNFLKARDGVEGAFGEVYMALYASMMSSTTTSLMITCSPSPS